MERTVKLAQMRKTRGLTQEQLAEELHVSRTAVSKWENGRGVPSIDSLQTLAEFFGVTVDEQFGVKAGIGVDAGRAQAERGRQAQVFSALLGVTARDPIGVNWAPYVPTSWGALVPVASMVAFFVVGLWQPVISKSLCAVDGAIWLLGAVYVTQLALFVLFNEVVLNWRSVLVEGVLEPSFPSSTSLLAVGALGPAAVWSWYRPRRCRRGVAIGACCALAALPVVGRTLSGVHWITDIADGVLLGLVLTLAYRGPIATGRK